MSLENFGMWIPEKKEVLLIKRADGSIIMAEPIEMKQKDNADGTVTITLEQTWYVNEIALKTT